MNETKKLEPCLICKREVILTKETTIDVIICHCGLCLYRKFPELMEDFINRWKTRHTKTTPSVEEIDRIIDSNKVDEVMTIDIKTVSDIKEFFNQHLEKIKQDLHDFLNKKEG